MLTQSPIFIGMLRIKNEARWIERVLKSLHFCQRIYIFDDHSTDETDLICAKFPKVVFLKSPFPEGMLDESRDKNYLLQRIIADLNPVEINIDSPYWVVCIDGDEELEPEAYDKLLHCVQEQGVSYFLKVLYLWNSPDQVRVDGVYRNFKRPSVFNIINPNFQYQLTPFGGNLHCSNIPQEYLGKARETNVSILHYGYMLPEDRIRKYHWYNTVDPHNFEEDCYRHVVQGDVDFVPADAQLRHAGPLELVSLASLGVQL